MEFVPVFTVVVGAVLTLLSVAAPFVIHPAGAGVCVGVPVLVSGAGILCAGIRDVREVDIFDTPASRFGPVRLTFTLTVTPRDSTTVKPITATTPDQRAGI